MTANDPRDISIDAFDYPLPEERIAKYPLRQRDACKLLCYSVRDNSVADRVFSDLPSLLAPESLLVVNNTKVVRARLEMRKPSGARVEIFCLEPEKPADYESNFGATGSCTWHCLVGNSKRWKDGPVEMRAVAGGCEVLLEAFRTSEQGVIEFRWSPASLSFSEVLATAGRIPIPPYLNRSSETTDNDDYQTVFSNYEGSVAAPTAGLHFTDSLLQRLADAGIERADVTLHVGAGTFQPVKSDTMGGHPMHSEFIEVERKFILRLVEQLKNRRPVVAVGTTSVRTIESLYYIGRDILEGKWSGEVWQWAPYDSCDSEPDTMDALEAIIDYLEEQGEDTLRARTRIIIAPGFRYRIVDTVITNFHQPKSTLLLLVSALIGDSWRCLYAHALDSGYRFLSYGDACLFSR